MKYRESTKEDLGPLNTMGKLLWSDLTDEEREDVLRDAIESTSKVMFVSQARTGELAGFAILSKRSDHVEGANTSPVGYLDGIFVYPGYRKQEVGKHLLQLGEEWCLENGCTQMGSDSSITDTDSKEFHLHVGFKETKKDTCFIKDLK